MVPAPLDPWSVSHVALRIELGHERVIVTSQISAACAGGDDVPLQLDGRDLETLEVAVDGRVLGPEDYGLTDDRLTLALPTGPHIVRTVVAVTPEGPGNKGLCSDGRVVHSCCEPQGFRRLTWSLDRPDNRSTFEVTLVGDPVVFPVMLANGRMDGRGTLDDGRQWVRYVDPVTKPTYLFSCVAGPFATVSRPYTTRTGRPLELVVAAPLEQIDGVGFALEKMAEVLDYDAGIGGIEHDLDTLVFVAVPGYSDATEYHGLMFFDPALLVADPRGHTDDDLMLIALNCAHEYGHHVRGHRVTVRSWDQLTLKEGLTVLMGQNGFRQHWLGPAARILDVLDLRRLQFPEEFTIGAPVVRDENVDPTSLYTRTTYLKGAEIFGMIGNVVGDEVWREAFSEFLTRFDLGAAGVDDFIGVVRETAPARAADIDAVARWFRVVGRPSIVVSTTNDSDGSMLTIERTDRLTDDPPVGFPVVVGFLDDEGDPLAVGVDDSPPADTVTLLVDSRRQSHRLRADRPVVVSPLRRYSAAVDLVDHGPLEHLGLRVQHDADAFARFWAAEALMISVVDAHRCGDVEAADAALRILADALAVVTREEADPLLLAQLLSVPDEFMLGDREPVIDVDGVADGLRHLRSGLGTRLHDDLLGAIQRFPSTVGGTSARDVASRWLVEPVLGLLLATGSDEGINAARTELACADHTRAVRALAQFAHLDDVDLEPLLADTRRRWQDAPTLLGRWIRAQSGGRRRDTIDRVRRLSAGGLYDRTDRARVMAVWFPFATRNRSVFHDPSGAGYRLFVDEVIALMPTRADLVVRLVGDLLQYRRFDDRRRDLLRAELERMVDAPGMPDFAVAIVRGLLADG